jgi:hypothetical protein
MITACITFPLPMSFKRSQCWPSSFASCLAGRGLRPNSRQIHHRGLVIDQLDPQAAGSGRRSPMRLLSGKMRGCEFVHRKA